MLKNKFLDSFISLRLELFGSVVRSDLFEAFGQFFSTATLSKILRDYGLRSKVAERKPRSIQRLANAPFEELDEDDLLRRLSCYHGFIASGVRLSEVPVLSRHGGAKSDPLPLKPGVFTDLVRAIIGKSAVEICYVGMALGDQKQWRWIFPIQILYIAGTWRVAAHDLTTSDFVIKTFVLPRITDFRIPVRDIPFRFKPGIYIEPTIQFTVTFSRALTDDQIEVLKHEIGVDGPKKGPFTVKMLKSAGLDFRMRYGQKPLVQDERSVWPPITIGPEELLSETLK